MLTFENAIENLARTFYELEGLVWAEASEEVRLANMMHLTEKAAEHPSLLDGLLRACRNEEVG